MIEKYTIAGIISCSFLILSLIFLIVRAYISQHPIFSFLQGNLLKPQMVFLASIAQAIYFMGFLFFILIFLFFSLFNYQWNQWLLLPTLLCLVSIIASFIFLFKSYEWKISYLKYRYIGLVLATIGFVGHSLKTEFSILATAHKIELSENINLLFHFPFYILLIIGILTIALSFPSANK